MLVPLEAGHRNQARQRVPAARPSSRNAAQPPPPGRMRWSVAGRKRQVVFTVRPLTVDDFFEQRGVPGVDQEGVHPVVRHRAVTGPSTVRPVANSTRRRPDDRGLAPDSNDFPNSCDGSAIASATSSSKIDPMPVAAPPITRGLMLSVLTMPIVPRKRLETNRPVVAGRRREPERRRQRPERAATQEPGPDPQTPPARRQQACRQGNGQRPAQHATRTDTDAKVEPRAFGAVGRVACTVNGAPRAARATLRRAKSAGLRVSRPPHASEIAETHQSEAQGDHFEPDVAQPAAERRRAVERGVAREAAAAVARLLIPPIEAASNQA